MSTSTPPKLTVVINSPVAPTAQDKKTDIKDLPQPIKKLGRDEKRVWDYLVAALAEYGLVHRTDSATLHVVVNTFVRWVEAEETLDKLVKDTGTYFVQTPNGYEQPHQKYYVARNLKKELLQWLPEACLTIPSFQKVMKAGEQVPSGQSDLFGDPLAQHAAAKPRLIPVQ